MGTVYLIHFDEPYQHARHYLGYTSLTVEERLERHNGERGARLLQVIGSNDINYRVVRTWKNVSRSLERRLKGSHSPLLCPVCNPEGWHRRGAVRPEEVE